MGGYVAYIYWFSGNRFSFTEFGKYTLKKMENKRKVRNFLTSPLAHRTHLSETAATWIMYKYLFLYLSLKLHIDI